MKGIEIYPVSVDEIAQSQSTGFLLNAVRWLIAISFVVPIINPAFGGTTFYFWIVLVFGDVPFVSKAIRALNRQLVCLFFAWLAVAILCAKLMIAVKICIIALGLTYLYFQFDEIWPKLYRCFIFSCFVCIVQFIAYFANSSLSYMLRPTTIAETLWGKYATATFSNQYVLFFLPRMSGLSREAGFFVSLLVIMILLRMREGKMSLKEKLLFTLCYLFSLSKVSMLLFFVAILRMVRKVLRAVPVALTLALILIVAYLVAVSLNIGSTGYMYWNESLAHRFSSAFLVPEMHWNNLLFGCDVNFHCFSRDAEPLINFLYYDNGYLPTVGVWGIVIELGILGLILLYITIRLLKLDSYDFVIIILFISTVSFFTLDSFVIFAYYYAMTNRFYQGRLTRK